MKALVTGFEPFGGDAINPSAAALHRLPSRLGDLVGGLAFDDVVGGLAIETRVLPTAFGRAIATLEDAVLTGAPDIVLCVGLAAGRPALSLERVAINIDDARIPDNDRQQPIDRPIVAGGPPAYFTTLPIKAAVTALRDAGLPAIVSNTAGTFVCNHTFYGLMHLAATRCPEMRGGFLHVPYLPDQAAREVGTPSMALDDIVRGIAIILRVTAGRRDDIAAAEGAII
jgi:pyroglutamyl-peptidase